ncbi:MAG: hypothetical protein JRE01_00635, partial [Deltaproteobacteria bacterium]|nr:hypothetical protein [Deltaproteobacteria bacterium]
DGLLLRLTLPASQPVGQLLELCRFLGLAIDDLSTDTAGLEEIFLQLTGSPAKELPQ